METLGSINLSWDNQGNVTFNYNDSRPNEELLEEVYALGGAALIDHMLSTISSKNILEFSLTIIDGLIKNKIDIKPIGSELKKAKLDIKRGKVLYTIFKPETKLFCNNQKLEFSLLQMALNAISTLLRNVADKNQLILRYRGYYIMVAYEEIVRKMYETNESQSVAHRKFIQAIAHCLNTVPNNITEEKLKDIFKGSSELIKNWKNLPLLGDKPILHF